MKIRLLDYANVEHFVEIPDDTEVIRGKIISGECFKNSAIVPVTDIDVNWSEYMVFGFDTMHFGDTWDYWTKERVAMEVENHITYANGIIEQYIEK